MARTVAAARPRGESSRLSGWQAAPEALGPLNSYVGYALRRAQSASFRHLERSAAGLALTPGQFSQLAVIDANPGINQRRLAALFGLDKSTLSPAIDALAERGLVRRTRATEDGRAWSLSLTGEGRQALTRMRAHVEAQERLIAQTLDAAELKRFVAALQRIEAALDAAD
jgi:DNA-binding MarR family transcriptional regulator